MQYFFLSSSFSPWVNAITWTSLRVCVCEHHIIIAWMEEFIGILSKKGLEQDNWIGQITPWRLSHSWGNIYIYFLQKANKFSTMKTSINGWWFNRATSCWQQQQQQPHIIHSFIHSCSHRKFSRLINSPPQLWSFIDDKRRRWSCQKGNHRKKRGKRNFHLVISGTMWRTNFNFQAINSLIHSFIPPPLLHLSISLFGRWMELWKIPSRNDDILSCHDLLSKKKKRPKLFFWSFVAFSTFGLSTRWNK